METVEASTMKLRQPLQSSGDSIAFLNALVSERQTGEVLFQNHNSSAKVYLHGGLIVWAFATGQEESFQSILIRENHLGKDQLLKGIRDAREQGKRTLNDILLSLGISDTSVRHNIIERHTKAALSTLSAWTSGLAQFNPYSAGTTEPTGGLTLASLIDELPQTNGSSAPTPSPSESPSRENPSRGDARIPTKKPTPSSRPNPAAVNERPSFKSELSAEEVHSIPDVLEQFRLEVPNFLAAMLIDGETGMPIATLSDLPELDVEIVSAFYRDLSKSALEALKAMGRGSVEGEDDGEPLEEVLITTNTDYVLLRSIRNGAHLLYLLIDKESNPGMARVVIRRYYEKLNSLLS